MSRENPASHVSPPSGISDEESRLAARAIVRRGAVPYGEGSIERIRDLLFGSYVQEINRQFSRLESRIQQETSELRELIVRHSDSVEDLKANLELLNQRLTTEQNTRARDIEKLARDAKELGNVLEKKSGQLAEETAAHQRELRELLLEQSKVLADEIRDRYADISTLLEQQLEDLRQDKTDRGTLAALFGEMSTRLSYESPPPQPDGETSE